MSTIGPERGDRSRAGWSERDPSDDEPVEHPLAIASEERYVDRELAGVGGMGTVMIAEDRRLGRAVALKRIAVDGDDRAAAARLAREAAITARLEHPSIVPVYDAGLGADGRAYYAMRLVRGRSLAEALAEAGALEARLRLVRAFLAVCQAMAYSHRHGVLHCDLKPANIMIGEFGEVHVVDWGLADTVDGAGAGDPGAGTPAYLAPERIKGEPATAASDVWALGAILAELICGRRLLPEDRVGILAAWAEAAVRPRWPERAPPELLAIADKALAEAPSARYRDAGPLAADVSAFLDGRRVGAHAYSTAELARRLIAAWRWQLAAAAAALVAGGLVLGATWTRIEGERRRAVTAERRATASLAESRSALAWALERSAVAALLAGDIAEAELLAAQALDYGESVDARGVLAATRAGGRPLTATRVDVPACGKITPDDGGDFVCHDGRWLTAWQAGAMTPRWRVPSRADVVATLRDGPLLAMESGVAMTLHDRATGAVIANGPVPLLTTRLLRSADGTRVAATSQRDLIVYDRRAPTATIELRPCEGDRVDAAALSARVVYVVCRDGRLRAFSDGGVREIATTPYSTDRRPATAMSVDADDQRLIIGAIDGEVRVVDVATGATRVARQVLVEPVWIIVESGDRVAIGGEGGALRIWGRELDAELMRLPERAGRRALATADGLVTGGASWWRWRLPEAPTPRRYLSPIGLSGAAVSPDGRVVAAARGDGLVSLWSTRMGAPLGELAVASQVVKRLDFAPDGRRLVAVIAGVPGEATIAVDRDPPEVIERRGGAAALRVEHLADGTRLTVRYGAHLAVDGADGSHRELPVELMSDLALTPDRVSGWMLGRTGGLWRYRGGEVTRLCVIDGARAVAPLDDTRAVVVRPAEVAIYGDDCQRRATLAAIDAEVLDVAVSPDRRWIAGATGGGTVEVWALADGRHVAHLRGHGARVVWVGFAAGALWSASWDGSLLRWDVAALSLDAATLTREATAAWGPLGSAR